MTDDIDIAQPYAGKWTCSECGDTSDNEHDPCSCDDTCTEHIETIDSLRRRLKKVEAERDALRRDGRALVEQFENISHALNDIGWPSENKLGTERACDALRSLAIDRESLNQQLGALRQQLEAVTRERDEAVRAHEASIPFRDALTRDQTAEAIAAWLESLIRKTPNMYVGEFYTANEVAGQIRDGSWRAKEGK